MKKEPTKKPVKKVVDDSPDWEESWREKEDRQDESDDFPVGRPQPGPIHKSEKIKPPTPDIGKAERRRKPVPRVTADDFEALGEIAKESEAIRAENTERRRRLGI